MNTQSSNIIYTDLSKENIEQVKRLNGVVLSVTYSNSFYQQLLENHTEFCRVAILDRKVIGAILCKRIEDRISILTFAVYADYRSQGIGSSLLSQVLTRIKEKCPEITALFLHVQTNNDGAINFYKRFGFTITETLKNYYRRLNPPDAYLLTKTLSSEKDSETANNAK